MSKLGLKGRNMKAQGNALGKGLPPRLIHALKGRNIKTTPHVPFMIFNNDRGRRNALVAPLQGLACSCTSVPRALPWAFLLQPLWGKQFWGKEFLCYRFPALRRTRK